jgi:hypothetical protein
MACTMQEKPSAAVEDGTWADTQALMYLCAVGNAKSHADVIGTDADPHIVTCKDASHDLRTSGGKIFQKFTDSVTLRRQEQKASGQEDPYSAVARSRLRECAKPSSKREPEVCVCVCVCVCV